MRNSCKKHQNIICSVMLLLSTLVFSNCKKSYDTVHIKRIDHSIFGDAVTEYDALENDTSIIHGKRMEYNPDNTLANVRSYRFGKQEGYFAIYDHGIIELEGNIENGLYEGELTSYWEGHKVIEKIYQKGRLIRINSINDSIIDKLYHGNFMMGSGELLIYFPDGKIHNLESYTNGIPNGKWLRFNEKGDTIARFDMMHGKYSHNGRLIPMEFYAVPGLIND